jgi:twinkle protein
VNPNLTEYYEATVDPLVARQITVETCQKFGVRVGSYHSKKVHFYPYYKDNQVVSCKVRDKDKNFTFIGDPANPPLFGQNLWSTGKKIIITEGEIDCLTVSQLQGNKWPTVSVPNGAQGARKSLSKNLEYFDGFEEIIIMFDMDEPGQKAARECAELFQPGKAKVASLPLKDPNECLLAGKGAEVISAIWNAKPYRPDGIISGSDLWEDVLKDDTKASVGYPWAPLNKKTGGMRRGELVTITAGSGIGKSAIVREIAHHLLKQGETVGMLMLEENPRRTALGLMGIEVNKPLHISKEGINETELHDAFNSTIGSGNCFLYDHWGSSDIQNLISRVRYLARGCNVRWVILDHLSIIVSGLGDGDERRLIDNCMTLLRTLVEETGIGMILVSHLKRPEGNRGHEEGATTSLSQLRGSHAIAQLSDIVIGLERNQQDVETANTTTLRVLKNRHSGDTGLAGELYYNRETGRLTEAPQVAEAYGF